MSVFLGIDIGTSGTKTLAIDERGKILAHATAEYPCYAPKPLWSEQEPDDWWKAVVATVREVMQKGKLKPADVKGIGLSGQMHGSVFLDKQDRVIRRALLWNDQRTTAECAEIEERAISEGWTQDRTELEVLRASRPKAPAMHVTDNTLGGQVPFRLCVNNYNEVPSPSGDCPTAVVLCDKSSFTVPKVVGTGSQNDEIGNVGCNGPSCVITESSSTWYKWTCRDAGTLTFSLSPLNPADDLDFVVYELPGGLDNCNSKTPIRCMASGENVGQPMASWLPCTGPTGLRTGETDTNETCGCPSGNNNFIAPINMVAGRSYALVVNNFSNSGDGYTVSFGGTGTFLGPIADFTTVPQTVCVGQSLTITDQASFVGTIIGRTWNFGVNSTPTVATGVGPHTVSFDRPGTKSILLTVETDRGFLVSKVLTVNVECCADHFADSQIITDVLCACASTGAID